MAIGGFELLGKDVITSDGRNVGTVTDLAIEPGGWKVRDLRVAIDKNIAQELGLDARRKFLVKTGSVKSVGDHVMLNQTMRMLADAAGIARKTGDDELFD